MDIWQNVRSHTAVLNRFSHVQANAAANLIKLLDFICFWKECRKIHSV